MRFCTANKKKTAKFAVFHCISKFDYLAPNTFTLSTSQVAADCVVEVYLNAIKMLLPAKDEISKLPEFTQPNLPSSVSYVGETLVQVVVAGFPE